MPKIPVYSQQSFTQAGGVTPHARGVQVADTGAGLRAIGAAVSGLAAVAEGYAQRQQQEREDDAVVKAGKELAEGELHWRKELQRRSDEWKEGDPPLMDTFKKDYDAWKGPVIEKAGTPKARRYTESRIDNLGSGLGLSAYNVDREKRSALNISRHEESVESRKQIVFLDPSQRDRIQSEALAELEALQGVDPAAKIARARKIKEDIDYSTGMGWKAKLGDTAFFKTISREVGTPGAAPAAGGAGGFEGSVARVLKHEGGYNASDGSSGAPVIYGINEKYNKAEFAEAMRITKEQGESAGKAYAAKVYRNKYWNAIGGDSLPAALQGTALDAAVNQGPANAKKWIAESGGDPTKFNALRKAHYEELLKKPENEKYRNAWMGRLAESGASGSVVVDGKRHELLPDSEQPSWFRGLSPVKKMQLLEESGRGSKSEKDSAFAGAALTASKTVVMAAPTQPDVPLDLPALKAQAVEQVAAQQGPLTPQQVLAVESSVEKAASDRERDTKREQETHVKSMFDVLDQNGGDYQAVVRDSPKVFEAMGRDAKERVQQYAEKVATGMTRATDWEAYNTLISAPESLKTFDLDAHRDRFNGKELAQLQKIQQALVKDPGTEDNVRANMAVVKERLDLAKITNKEDQAKFYSLLQSAIDQELMATGKKALRQSEIKSLADDLLVSKITSKGVLWNSTEKAFKIEVPQAERVKIEAALKANGMPVSEYEILRQYKKKLETAK